MSGVLFLCTGNSCRSQMAEAWARTVLPPEWQVYSAGIEKHGLNPLMLRVMDEAGVDMEGHTSKTTDELPQEMPWALVVTVCGHAEANCPHFAAKRHLHMPFDDPPALTRGMSQDEALPVYRRVRDEIRLSVSLLAQQLISENP